MKAEYQGSTISINPTSLHAGIFSQFFGRLERIPVMHATPHQVVILDTAETKTVCELNLSRLTPGEFIWPVSYCVEQPNVIPDNIRLMFKQQGLLIAADDVTVEGVNLMDLEFFFPAGAAQGGAINFFHPIDSLL